MGCAGSKDVIPATPIIKKDADATAPSTEKPAAKPAPGASAFAFASPLPDCVSSNPDVYKVVAELPGARLVEMTIEPGQEDIPHDHPAHSMFFVQGGKLSITDYDTDGKSKNNAHEIEIPAGAPPIFPAGAHKVKNVGNTTVKVVFIEPYVTCQPCGDIEGYVSPFEVAPQCYKVSKSGVVRARGIASVAFFRWPAAARPHAGVHALLRERGTLARSCVPMRSCVWRPEACGALSRAFCANAHRCSRRTTTGSPG